MIELRWVERSIHDETFQYVGEEKVLQYRTINWMILDDCFAPNPPMPRKMQWSDWQDVPTQ